MSCPFAAALSVDLFPRPTPAEKGQRATDLFLRRFLQDLADVPSLPLGERTRLLDHHPVAHIAVVGLGVRQELAGPADVLLIHRMHDDVFDRHHHRLLHLVRYHHTGLGALIRALLGALRSRFFVSHCLRSPLSRRVDRSPRTTSGRGYALDFSPSSVLMRAISRRTSRIFMGLSTLPVLR